MPGISTSRMTRVGLGFVVEPLERLVAVLGQLDVVALELERAAQRLAHGPLVVDDQDLHVRIVRDQREKFLDPLLEQALREFLGNVQPALNLG